MENIMATHGAREFKSKVNVTQVALYLPRAVTAFVTNNNE
jgi:hypothetical protein